MKSHVHAHLRCEPHLVYLCPSKLYRPRYGLAPQFCRDLVTTNLPFAQALEQIQRKAAETPIDVFLYVDRADLYRVEPVDHEVPIVTPAYQG